MYNYSKFKSKMQAPVLNDIKVAKGTTSVPFAIIFFEYESSASLRQIFFECLYLRIIGYKAVFLQFSLQEQSVYSLTIAYLHTVIFNGKNVL